MRPISLNCLSDVRQEADDNAAKEEVVWARSSVSSLTFAASRRGMRSSKANFACFNCGPHKNGELIKIWMNRLSYEKAWIEHVFASVNVERLERSGDRPRTARPSESTKGNSRTVKLFKTLVTGPKSSLTTFPVIGPGAKIRNSLSWVRWGERERNGIILSASKREVPPIDNNSS